METAITFDCRGLTLEGRLAGNSTTKCAVITHPHPLYGGNMDNIVVNTIADAYGQNGWSCLRFNFRGTGASQGAYDDGSSEQLDIEAAIAYLASRAFQTIALAGYSFGAWVLAAWSQNHPDHPHDIRMVAPPVAFMDFSGIRRIPGLRQVVTGGRDEVAPAGQVASLMPVWHAEAELSVIQPADHFFSDHLQTLRETIAGHIAQDTAQ